jgi:hypothetical protein
MIETWNYSLSPLYLIHVMNRRCTMICVQCYLQKYLHRSKKAWIMHEKNGLWNTWIGDQMQVLPKLPPGHHITCGIRKQGGQVYYDLKRLIWISGTVHTKIITKITYGLRFERSLYGWKDKRINFQMDLVSCPTPSYFIGNVKTIRHT